MNENTHRDPVERVRALHAKHENAIYTTPKWICAHRYCVDGAGDQCAWPCPTIRALDEPGSRS